MNVPPRKKQQDDHVAVIETKVVPVDGLQVYYKNPRVGDVKEIAKSLHVNRQFKPIVVNIGTHTGRDNEILAGNHTYLAAREDVTWQANGVTYEKQPWTNIYASFVDVDEDAARRINLADNATADKGSYDDQMLAELLSQIPDVSGTGYSMEEAESIIDQYKVDDDDVEDFYDTSDIDEVEEGEKPKAFEDTSLGDEEEAEDDRPRVTTREREKMREEGKDIDKQSDSLKGSFQLDEDPDFDFVGELDTPRLLPDKLMTPDELPEKLKTWAGSATRDEEDPDVWWFYNYGVDSTSGMQDISKVIVGFYTHDDYFEPWWHAPAKFTTKILNSKIKYISTPDFSPVNELGRTFWLWQMYRSRWLGRYFQEAGLTLLPHITWPDGEIDFLEEHVISTLPDDVPMLSIQLQTIDPDKVTGGMDHFKKQVQLVVSKVQPEVLFCYAGKPGLELAESLNLGSTRLHHMVPRQHALSERAKKRERKTTI
jgi:Domain of unknown function (DUF4417)